MEMILDDVLRPLWLVQSAPATMAVFCFVRYRWFHRDSIWKILCECLLLIPSLLSLSLAMQWVPAVDILDWALYVILLTCAQVPTTIFFIARFFLSKPRQVNQTLQWRTFVATAALAVFLVSHDAVGLAVRKIGRYKPNEVPFGVWFLP